MSRLSATEIINQGRYLEPDFEPSTLTVSQLLGVLGFHNITYPTPYSKSKLVQLFNEQIQGRAAKFKKERIQKENSIASDEGIRDGVTGELIGAPAKPAPRRSSRRSSRVPSEDVFSGNPPDPPKRRRSSAQPRLGESSRQSNIMSIDPTVAEESEPEDIPIRKVPRTKNNADNDGRRISLNDDSGWEDNNIFQSGAESSSPARPPSKSRRSSAPPRKSRNYSSVPPLPSPPTSPALPSIKFEPRLSPLPDIGRRSPSVLPNEVPDKFKFDMENHGDDVDELDLIGNTHGDAEVAYDWQEEKDLEDSVEDSDIEDSNEEQMALVRSEPAHLGYSSRPIWTLSRRVVYFALLLLLGSSVWTYKVESRAYGFCDAGSTTNEALEKERAFRFAVAACNKDNRTTLYSSSGDPRPCPPEPLPWPVPDHCTPCPSHATCNRHSISCLPGYELKSHPVFGFMRPVADRSRASPSSSDPVEVVWSVVSSALDGIPGLGSVAFPPSCHPDPKVGALGKGILAILGQERGKRLCTGMANQSLTDKEGGEARQWGFAVEELKKSMGQDIPTSKWKSFEQTFDTALKEVKQLEGFLVFGTDAKGTQYVAHQTPLLTWDCQLTVKVRESWEQWKYMFFGLVLSVCLVIRQRQRRRWKAVEDQRVGQLVQTIFEALKDQELAHYTDPVSYPHAYLSSAQLRDSLLQEVHSTSSRQKVWNKVEKIVESNTNIRANLEEVEDGDELRVWRWIGQSGRRLGTKSPIYEEAS